MVFEGLEARLGYGFGYGIFVARIRVRFHRSGSPISSDVLFPHGATHIDFFSFFVEFYVEMNKGVGIGNIGCGKSGSRSKLDGRELREVDEDRGLVGEEGDKRAIYILMRKKKREK